MAIGGLLAPAGRVREENVVACFRGHLHATDHAIRTAPDSAHAGWRRFDGPVFSLRLPPEATVRADTVDGEAALVFEGPRILLRTGNEFIGDHTGPMYELAVFTYSNANRWTAAQWVDSIRRARTDGQTDPDSLWYLAPPDTLVSGNVRALRLEPWCGDCQLEDLYLADENHRVRLGIVYDISIPGDRAQQARLYRAILGTFAWKPVP